MIYLRYLKRLLSHKWYVLVAGRGTVPMWRLLIHDWTKFLPSEYPVYARRFGNGRGGAPIDPNQEQNDWWKAWNHHWHHNPHHWEHWLTVIGGQLVPTEMPETYVNEMVADWRGASRAHTGKWEIVDWYMKNYDRIVLHEATRDLVASRVFTQWPGVV